MITWKLWEGEAKKWDEQLLVFPDYNVYQSYGWGEHKKHAGWLTYRFIALSDTRIVSMVQVLIKKFRFGIAIGWVAGGPIGHMETWDEELFQEMRKAVGVSHLYLRVNQFRVGDEEDESLMKQKGWKRAIYPILSGKSVLLRLLNDQASWLKSITSKHRYYVKKSLKTDLTWKSGDEDVLLTHLDQLTERLSRDKGMNLRERDIHALRDLKNSLSEGGLRVVVGYINEKPVTACMVLICGVKAIYATAATVEEGRGLSAAYAMFYHLREYLMEQKIVDLDFGGINPASEKARGVDHFKLGFSGTEVSYLGEWDRSTSAWLRVVANFLIKRRLGSM